MTNDSDDEDAFLRAVANANISGPKDLKSKLAELERTPLFMTALPTDGQENVAFEAMQALLYDGSPEEIATNFKNQGNEAFKERRYKDARVFYSRGLDHKCDDIDLNTTLLVNRAAAHIELGNYRQVLLDCAAALKLSPKNVKAFYRSARACTALERFEEAVDCCERGLEIDPTNDALKRELEVIETKRGEAVKHQEAKRAQQLEIQAQDQALSDALKARNIRSIETGSGIHPAAEDHHILLDPATNTLSIPVLFLYPEYSQSDFIAAFNENDTFGEHIHTVFDDPPPWDAKKEYLPDKLDVYFETRNDGHPKLVRIGHDRVLKDVFRHDGFRIVDGVASFFVVVGGSMFAKQFRKLYRK
ncbi:hypothetical protein SmJEL517_g01638 [Synchytrium microbalum]|uniref:Cns1/TTC4 wheel domain-containing protein n=1 Tax=Synchytrium microbalum TaxID=1806994 RepID=A0A507C9A7_9FUNG|nr:uncharacterized protein SmJEL517_g01638 [Synchytrium microbalum]TPX36182.1 hypothetical protein SmJEL517_g01638 [Synchytrium microbalum]